MSDEEEKSLRQLQKSFRPFTMIVCLGPADWVLRHDDFEMPMMPHSEKLVTPVDLLTPSFQSWLGHLCSSWLRWLCDPSDALRISPDGDGGLAGRELVRKMMKYLDESGLAAHLLIVKKWPFVFPLHQADLIVNPAFDIPSGDILGVLKDIPKHKFPWV